MSLLEKSVETAIAFIIALLLSPVFFAINGIDSNHSQNFNVVICFTILAVVRGYIVRRVFNWIQSIIHNHS